jgi:hypothetical protein
MKYIVKTKRNVNGSTFTGKMFQDAVIEYIDGDADTETYEIVTERDLDRVLDTSPDVIEYSMID